MPELYWCVNVTACSSERRCFEVCRPGYFTGNGAYLQLREICLLAKLTVFLGIQKAFKYQGFDLGYCCNRQFHAVSGKYPVGRTACAGRMIRTIVIATIDTTGTRTNHTLALVEHETLRRSYGHNALRNSGEYTFMNNQDFPTVSAINKSSYRFRGSIWYRAPPIFLRSRNVAKRQALGG